MLIMFLCFKTYNPAELWTKRKNPKENQIKLPENVTYVKMLMKPEVSVFLNGLLSCL